MWGAPKCGGPGAQAPVAPPLIRRCISPPYISPPMYKPSKKCLRTNISPGLIIGGLRYSPDTICQRILSPLIRFPHDNVSPKRQKHRFSNFVDNMPPKDKSSDFQICFDIFQLSYSKWFSAPFSRFLFALEVCCFYYF